MVKNVCFCKRTWLGTWSVRLVETTSTSWYTSNIVMNLGVSVIFSCRFMQEKIQLCTTLDMGLLAKGGVNTRHLAHTISNMAMEEEGTPEARYKAQEESKVHEQTASKQEQVFKRGKESKSKGKRKKRNRKQAARPKSKQAATATAIFELELVSCRFRKQQWHEQLPTRGAICPSLACCFSVATPTFEGLGKWNLKLVSCRSESNVTHYQLQNGGTICPSLTRHQLIEGLGDLEFGASFLPVQKATLGTTVPARRHDLSLTGMLFQRGDTSYLKGLEYVIWS